MKFSRVSRCRQPTGVLIARLSYVWRNIVDAVIDTLSRTEHTQRFRVGRGHAATTLLSVQP